MTSSALESIVVSSGYFERVGEAICRIALARSEAETSHLLREATQHLGADVAVFCSFVRDAPGQTYFMPTCDPQWIHEYERVVSPIHDPWIVHATESSEPTCGSHLNIRSHPQLEAISLARRYGFESTLVVPAPSVGVTPQLGVLVLGSHIEGFFESDGLMAVKVMARSLAMELHDWRLSQNRRDFIMRARLTGADLELLRHVRRGLGSKQIAHELRTSSNAIDLRLSRLSSRLGVPSRSAAATLAATYGLIY